MPPLQIRRNFISNCSQDIIVKMLNILYKLHKSTLTSKEAIKVVNNKPEKQIKFIKVNANRTLTRTKTMKK